MEFPTKFGNWWRMYMTRVYTFWVTNYCAPCAPSQLTESALQLKIACVQVTTQGWPLLLSGLPKELSTMGSDQVDRGNWSGKLDFLLSCIGYAVGKILKLILSVTFTDFNFRAKKKAWVTFGGFLICVLNMAEEPFLSRMPLCWPSLESRAFSWKSLLDNILQWDLSQSTQTCRLYSKVNVWPCFLLILWFWRKVEILYRWNQL